MDPLTASIVVVLGRYALDKGVELGKEVGPKALETAKEMFALALDRLRGRPAGDYVARNFEEDPVTYEKPLQKELDKEISSDPDLAARLQALWAQYEEAARSHAAATGTTYKATLKGSGAIAQGRGAVAAGKGGIAIGTSHGSITVGRTEDKKPAAEDT